MQFLIDIGLSLVYFCLFLLVCAWTWRFWMMYIQQKAMSNLDWIMLEIKLPREIFKSPLATEAALSVFLQSAGASTKYARNFEGKLPQYSSLEIASIEGVIHFYIRTQRKFKNLVESHFYAQYPGIEIVEADDYTSRIRFHHLSKDVKLFGMNYKPSEKWKPINEEKGKPYEDDKGKPYKMPADFFPIKTYTNFGLDKDPKEEFKIDPLTPLLETMGSLGKGEHMWYQILIEDESVYNGDGKMPKFYVNTVNHEHMSLKEMADKYKKDLRTGGYSIKNEPVVDEYGVQQMRKTGKKDAEGKDEMVPAFYPATKAEKKKEIELTSEEKEKIESIGEKFSKPLALVVVRILYVAKTENFDAGKLGSMLTFPKLFTGSNSMSLFRVTDPYDYPWEKLGDKRIYWRAEETFESYVEREGFYPHIPKRDSLDKWEDIFFWPSSMKNRRIFRMIYEAIFYPFDHPEAEEAFTLNLEEVATLWHLPGATASVPTLPRIDSTKGKAPSNLPL